MAEADVRLTQILHDAGELSQKIFNEKQQRLLSGCISKAYGYGGDKIVASAFGLDPRTVSAGRASAEKGDIDVSQERIRQEGGGRKAVKNQQPEILKAVEEIVSNSTYGSPEDDLLWINLSLRAISEELKRKGYTAGKDLVGRLLEEIGYSKPVNQKYLQAGKAHPGRDEMFKRINQAIEDFRNEGNPVLATDTKKKELIGNFRNNEAEYRKQKDWRKVLDHDFPVPELVISICLTISKYHYIFTVEFAQRNICSSFFL